MTKKLNYIDLFAGAGGLSEGFIKAGFNPIAHVEMDEAACYTLQTRVAYHHLKSSNQFDNYVSYLKGEINRNELYALVPSYLLQSVINLPIGAESNKIIHETIRRNLETREVDLIIGGPPCQAYSLIGRARSENSMATDPRNYLYIQYAKYLEKYQPKMFVFENVLGLKSAKGGLFLANMEKLFYKKGYKIQVFTVEANNFDVLQNRKRIIIIGWKDDFTPNLPNLSAIRSENNYLVKNLLSDLPKLNAGEGVDKFSKYQSDTTEYLRATGIRNGINVLTQHVARPHTDQDIEIYKIAIEKWNEGKSRLDYNDLPSKLKTHKNRISFFDRFKIIAGDLPFSQTIAAHISKDGHYYIHPYINKPRSITVREAARLQSFPDDFYFEGAREGKNRTAAFKQIGNAVPPLMANCIANTLKQILNGI
ncbi:DNA cytosine methyltransferase [Ferruginibacter sp.]|nr:DNA cytosine methyltransferase [Ferruginibacter sp.]